MTKTLDLGCGDHPRNPFNADEIYGVDINDFGLPNIKIADLAIDPIPYEDNMFDYVSGRDFLEHVPRVLYNGRTRTQPFIDLMSEVWRVLKPNGKAIFITPAFPYQEAFMDPQHVNIITEQTIAYFVRQHDFLKIGQMYGFKGQFDLISQKWTTEYGIHHLIWEIQAVK